MNDQRRKQLRRALDLIDQAREIVGEAGDDEQASFECLPESTQKRERGQEIKEKAEELNDCALVFEDLISTIEEAAS